MTQTGGLAQLEVLPRLYTQVKALVVVLTVADKAAEVGGLSDQLTATAATAEPLLRGIDSAMLVELRRAFARPRQPRRRAARRPARRQGRLAVLFHADRPRRAAIRSVNDPAVSSSAANMRV